jgi:hypothetical protein
MAEPDFKGLREADQAAFKPHFAEVRRRAARRRHRVQAAAVTLAAGAVAAGFGIAAVRHGSGYAMPAGVPDATPSFIPAPHSSQQAPTTPFHRAYLRRMVAGDVGHLYQPYDDCRGKDCTPMLARLAGGTAWTKVPIPVPKNTRVYQLDAVGPTTLVLWYQVDGTGHQNYLTSTDAGTRWTLMTVRSVDRIPDGWRLLDAEPEATGTSVWAADPATGQVARLAQPLPLTRAMVFTGLPAGAGIWVSGYEGTTNTTSVVEVSRDGGATWQRSTFPAGFDAGEQNAGAAAVATVDGTTVYAVGHAPDGSVLVEKSTDGGRTWADTGPRLPSTTPVRLYASTRPDGTLLVQVGDQAGDHPKMYQLTGSPAPVPVGPGAQTRVLSTGYAQLAWPNNNGLYLSSDGLQWTYVAPPPLP